MEMISTNGHGIVAFNLCSRVLFQFCCNSVRVSAYVEVMALSGPSTSRLSLGIITNRCAMKRCSVVDRKFTATLSPLSVDLSLARKSVQYR